MKPIYKVLMDRDKISAEQAKLQVQDAKSELHERLANGENPLEVMDICEEHFGLEPDYLDELMF